MERRVLYLRPQAETGNGVRAYSDRVLEAFRRYGDGRYLLVDASGCLDEGAAAPERLTLRLGERLAELARRESAPLVFAEMGVGEFRVFHALRGLKRLAPEIPTLVTVHDPPRTVVNLNPLFHARQGATAVRALRWLYNRTLGKETERQFLSQGHHWLLLSEKGRALWLDKLKVRGVVPRRVDMLPHLNYFDTLCSPAAACGAGLRRERALRLGVLGSITRSKGIDLLIDALALLRREGALPAPLALEIAGAPLYRQDQRHLEELKRQVSRVGLEELVFFSGYLPDEELPDFFSRIDLLVLPYRETGSGSASGPLMWARSFGVPVVATRTRNLPELVRHGEDGMLCAAGDAGALAAALGAALREPVLARLREGASQRRELCSWAGCVAGLSGLFDGILAADKDGIST